MSENLKHFLWDISAISHKVVQITVQYKNDSQSGLRSIVEIANREGLTFTEGELEAVIINYERLRNQEFEYSQYENIGFPQKNGDEVISNALQYFDKDFLRNLTLNYLKRHKSI
ncbi:MAG: hypothetical protein RM022_033095 [Nostoc sp. EfeVER01]|uniref:hypothetical protein n=1 Tax=Nostoc sp. EfeVER01 TaxID=3075406 RepID=UPI00391AAF44